MINQAIASLHDSDVCLESLWHYDLLPVNLQLSAQDYQTAQNHKVTAWFQLKISPNQMKLCLA